MLPGQQPPGCSRPRRYNLQIVAWHDEPRRVRKVHPRHSSATLHDDSTHGVDRPRYLVAQLDHPSLCFAEAPSSADQGLHPEILSFMSSSTAHVRLDMRSGKDDLVPIDSLGPHENLACGSNQRHHLRLAPVLAPSSIRLANRRRMREVASTGHCEQVMPPSRARHSRVSFRCNT